MGKLEVKILSYHLIQKIYENGIDLLHSPICGYPYAKYIVWAEIA